MNSRRMKYLARFSTCAALVLAAWYPAHGQTTWTNDAGGEWNNANNWNPNQVPGQYDQAEITNSSVAYDAPMAAPSFMGLTLGGALTVNTNSFIIDALGGVPLTVNNGGLLTVTPNGVVTITNSGAVSLETGSGVDIEGGSFIMTNTIAGSSGITMGSSGNNAGVGFTNNAGTIILDQPLEMRGRYSQFIMNGGTLVMNAGGGVYEANNDQERPFLINGGTAFLGDFSVSRTTSGGGLQISNGVVTATSLQIGNTAAGAYSSVYGGVLTNTGSFTINDRNNGATSKDRRIFFRIYGGSVVSTSTDGIVVVNQGNTGAAGESTLGGNLIVSGGSLTAEKITLIKDTTLANAFATLTLSGNASLYLGSGGLIGNVGVDNTAYHFNLNGGTLAAKDSPFTITADVTLGGSGTIQTADADGNPCDITIAGGLLGSGDLTKTGLGTLTLQGSGTHSGVIRVEQGTFALGGGSISNTATLSVDAGATFDAGSGFTLNSSQNLEGSGSVTNNVTAADGSNLSPGGLGVVGTLTLDNDLIESGGAMQTFDLESSTSSDLLIVKGALNLSALNTIFVNGFAPGGTYQLIEYGTFSGDISNLKLVGTTGVLTNNAADHAIELVVNLERNPLDLVWQGDGVANIWNTGGATNWINGGTAYRFLPNDAAIFNDIGSTNPPINITGSVAPSALTVDATEDYTFQGSGKITGPVSVTKTNSGTLTILNQNDYVGVTTIAGGTVAVTNLTDAGVPGPLGAAPDNATNIVLNGGTLAYQGAGQTWGRSLTVGTNGGTISETNASATLTTTGVIQGDGKLTKAGPGAWSVQAANTYSGGTEIEAGTLSLDSSASLGDGPLTLNGGETPATFTFTKDGQSLDNELVIQNTNNVIQNNGNDYIHDMSGDGTLFVDFSSGSYLSPRGDMSAFSGKIILSDNGVNFRFYAGSEVGSTNATFDLGNGSSLLAVRNGNRLVHLGALIGGPSATISGALSDANPTTYEIGGNGMSTLFEGTIQNGRSGASSLALTKVGPGTLTLDGTLSYTGDTIIRGGTFVLSNSASIQTSSNLVVNAGAALDLSAELDPTLYQYDLGQSVSGGGTIRGSVYTLGSVFPGDNGVGTLTVTTNITLDGPVVMELDRAQSPSSDRIVAQAITGDYSGSLVVTNLGGRLYPGDTFQLFSEPLSGGFATVDLPTTGPSYMTYTWTNKLDQDGTIQVLTATSTVDTTPTNITARFTPGGNTLNLSWPEDHIGWQLQVQTNNLATGISTNWVNVPGSTSTNGARVNIDSSKGSVFYRLILP